MYNVGLDGELPSILDYQIGDRVTYHDRCVPVTARVLEIDLPRRTLRVGLESEPVGRDEVLPVEYVDEHLPLTADEIQFCLLGEPWKITMNDQGYAVVRRLISEGLHMPHAMVHVEPEQPVCNGRIRIRLGGRWL